MKEQLFWVNKESYHQCRRCGQYHNTTARDCNAETPTDFDVIVDPNYGKRYRLLNGKLFQVFDTAPNADLFIKRSVD